MSTARSLLDDADFLAALDGSDVAAARDTWPAGQPHWIYDAPPAPPPARHGRIALGVLGFTLMMGLGAAGAALVFQDRLALLLR